MAGILGGTTTKKGVIGGSSGTTGLLGSTQNLTTSSGLYDVAAKSGLQKQADEILAQKGEDANKIFSGGMFTDIFDALNTLDYGVVGMLKGKSFADGIKNRESFTDKDALGGSLAGTVVGTLLDIAVDPLTYIAPATILSKIPGATKAGKAIKVIAEESKVGKYLGEKFIWMFGQDPVFKNAIEKSIKNIGVSQSSINKLVEGISQLPTDKVSQLLTKDDTGRFIRRNIDELSGFTDDELFAVSKTYSVLDDLGKEAVDLGLLSKGKWEENVGQYIKNTYDKFELEKGKGIFGFAKGGVKGQKKRVEGLTEKGMKELGQIDNPAYLLLRSMTDLSADVENVKLFNQIAKTFGSDVAKEGFEKMPTGAKFFTTSTGEKIQTYTKIKELNKSLKQPLKDLKNTFKADRKTLSEINSLEKELDKLSGLREDEFYKFFSEGAPITKTSTIARKLGTIPDNLVSIASKIKNYDSYEKFFDSRVGIEVEKLFQEGVLERSGFKSIKDFYESAIGKYVPESEKIITKDADIIPEFVVKGDKIIEKKAGKEVSRNMDEVEKKLYETKIAKEGLPLKSRIKENAKPSLKESTFKDLDLLKQKITNFNKGYRFAAKEIKENQSKIIEVIRDNFNLIERGKFLAKIKNATTKEKTLSLIDDLEESFKNILAKNSELYGQDSLNKLISIQKQIEKLTPKLENIKDIDKKSIDDSYRFLEDTINGIQMEKQGLRESLSGIKTGELAGKYVPAPIYRYFTELEKAKSEADKGWSKLVGAFKYNKVILNPATHARNIMSNAILNYWKLGVNPITNANDYAEAFAEISKGSGKWISEARTAGYGIDSFAANELKNNFLQGSSGLAGKAKKGLDKLADMYQQEENFAKLTAFIAQRKKGIGIEDAWKAAESATFNYAQVTPFIRRLRQSIWGYPFITFTLKATPLAAETALKRTGRVSVFGKIKISIENQTDQKELEKERKNEPAWIRNGFYVKLPMKDSNGNSAYFDMTYIIPFGDLASGQFMEGKVSRETGLEAGKAQTLVSKSPALNLISEIAKNEDFYGDKIWKDSDTQEKQLGDLFRHITKTLAPPMVSEQLPGGYIQQGTKQGQRRQKGIFTKTTEEEKKQTLTATEQLMKQFGMKIQPMNADIQETYMEWEKKKALESLLGEAGVVKEFQRTYIPK
jgi:hypothetical protein